MFTVTVRQECGGNDGRRSSRKGKVLRVDTCDGLSDELSRANDRCFDTEVTMTERQFVSRAIAVRENHIRWSSLVVHDS